MAAVRQWTDAQLQAINIRNKTLLVSAAAGSGKTATLTERIIRRITDRDDPADISKMLIVTFTRAAAAELRSRIFAALGDALAEDPSSKHLSEQLMKIGSAQISTIDSFYFDLIQSNVTALGINSSIRIADDTEYSVLAHKVMESVIDNAYEEEPDFASFIECFAGIRQSNILPDIFLDIHKKLSSIPEGIDYLGDCAVRTAEEATLDFFSTSYGVILKESTAEFTEHYYNVLKDAVEFISLDEMVSKKYGASFLYDLSVCSALRDAICDDEHGYSRARDIIISYSPIPLSALSSKYASEQSKIYTAKRTEFIERMKAFAQKAFAKSPETIERAMIDTAKRIFMLGKLLMYFEETVAEEKSRLGILTFNDIRRLTLSLLIDDKTGEPTEIAKQYREKYTDIFIDEYQDIDCVQDLIFSSIAKPDNRFMVGDIKQSIYQFRGAEPLLFSRYRSSFPLYSSPEAESSQAVSIFMSNNFRCDKSVIDFTNLVCGTIFSVASEGIGYTRDDDLCFSKKVPDGYVSPKVKIGIVKAPSATERKQLSGNAPMTTHEVEAEYIASEIEALLKDGVKADGSKIIPGDIAVLFRSKAISPFISNALKKRGILSSEADTGKYFESPEVLLVLSLLKTIDNPQRDTFLAGTLRSPLFNFEMDELLKIRISADSGAMSLFDALCAYAEKNSDALAEKCSDFLRALDNWQNDCRSVSIDRFLRMLFDSERFLATGLVSQTRDDGNGGNLLLLYEYARGFENGSFKGLYQFIEYIDSMIENGQSFSSSETSIYPDRVSLMTIHKSKGLEFPVCFVCDTTHSIRSKDISSTFVFDYHSGVALKIAHESGMARINTPMREAIISRLLEKQSEEEMRILYVALTRARERLYITAATTRDPDKILSAASIRRMFLDKYSATNICTSYLDWILLSCDTSASECFEIELKNYDELSSAEEEDAHEVTDLNDTDNNITYLEEKEAFLALLKERFEFKYPYASLSRIPSKLSVSRLYPDILDENDSSLDLFVDEKPSPIPDFFLERRVEKQISAAERGTATHLFLQFCDFKQARIHGAKEELARLVKSRFISQSIADLVYLDEIEEFIKSPLIDEILEAKSVIREQRFNVALSPEEFTSDISLKRSLNGELLAVQGVIDLILVDAQGRITLIDYKTDRLTANELSNEALAQEKFNSRHALQLSYYSLACRALFGKPCDKIFIYSTHAARTYEVDVNASVYRLEQIQIN